MPGSYARLEDEVSVTIRDAMPVVDHSQGAIAAAAQDRCDIDIFGPSVPRVTQKFHESVFDGVDTRGAAPSALDPGKPGEATSEVPVRPLSVVFRYRATSLTRLSRITVTLICPGYSRSCSICFEMSKASLAAMRSSTSDG